MLLLVCCCSVIRRQPVCACVRPLLVRAHSLCLVPSYVCWQHVLDALRLLTLTCICMRGTSVRECTQARSRARRHVSAHIQASRNLTLRVCQRARTRAHTHVIGMARRACGRVRGGHSRKFVAPQRRQSVFRQGVTATAERSCHQPIAYPTNLAQCPPPGRRGLCLQPNTERQWVRSLNKSPQ